MRGTLLASMNNTANVTTSISSSSLLYLDLHTVQTRRSYLIWFMFALYTDVVGVCFTNALWRQYDLYSCCIHTMLVYASHKYLVDTTIQSCVYWYIFVQFNAMLLIHSSRGNTNIAPGLLHRRCQFPSRRKTRNVVSLPGRNLSPVHELPNHQRVDIGGKGWYIMGRPLEET